MTDQELYDLLVDSWDAGAWDGVEKAIAVLRDRDLRRRLGEPRPAAWCLGDPRSADSSNVLLAHEFTPDEESHGVHEWTPLYLSQHSGAE